MIFFKSFELYVLILISTTILQNLAGAILASKLYPYINNKTKDRVDKKEVKELFKDCRAIILYRINDVVLKATDNLVISASLGLAAVGIYSNYYILYRTINQIFNKIFESVVHSLGNLHTEKNYNHEYVVFKTTNFIAIILGATAGIGVFCVSNELIFLWIGKKWILAQPFSLLMGFEAYTLASRLYLSRWRTAMGLFQQAKYRPVFAMIINLIVSIILVKYLGICGVLIGTIIADWTTIIWYEPLIIHKHGLKNKFSLKLYYLKNFSYLLVLIFAAFINYEICKNLFLGLGWLSFAIHTLICGMLTPLIFLFIYRKTDEGKYFIGILKKQFKRKKLRRA